MMPEVRTILQDLPVDIRGFVVTDENGDPTVVLNARHSRETNLETYRHEVAHILGNDLYRPESANEIEAWSHS
jgi:hypothetical protein|nr:MAG TPA: Protein of unknown function (DUF3920) [Caudoviricetes sp.]